MSSALAMQMQGFLEKMGGSVHSWKRRFFVLRLKSLEYYKDQNMKEKLGFIPLVDCSVSIEQPTGDPGYYFLLHVPPSAQAKRPDFLIRASSDKERKEWMDKIRECTVITVFKQRLFNATMVNPNRVGLYLPIPYFISKAIKFIEENLDVEGIYRHNGSSVKYEETVELINQNKDVEFTHCHDATGTVKLFLRTLSTSIIPPQNFEKLKTLSSLPLEKQIEDLRSMIRLLPISNYCLLAYLFAHLRRVLEHSGSNLMDARAISVCIGPSLVYSEEGNSNEAFTESSVQQSLCTCIIDNYDEIFGENPLMYYNSTGVTSFNIVVMQLDEDCPFMLRAPQGSIVQTVAVDCDGWTISVYNNNWGCVHKTALEPIKDSKTIVNAIASQTQKWELTQSQLINLQNKCPEAVQLYQALQDKLKALREKCK
ncbi:rho GTPase-activating protein 24 isoform X1 [Histomonas meleagridis]|uniref:rho GTPase-activating protein 24 isoform X1 n=1 Tax=Histomonas meleagridis TaxID=135588 RepID=UPI00355ABC4C|nr:rho GTPase-activating protein 24 isoform X1 [Histomonas meleagridis]KAH0803709.1 rho GTPase-activating protein 24 isoform X1 [Histomonas meleagridis]